MFIEIIYVNKPFLWKSEKLYISHRRYLTEELLIIVFHQEMSYFEIVFMLDNFNNFNNTLISIIKYCFI